MRLCKAAEAAQNAFPAWASTLLRYVALVFLFKFKELLQRDWDELNTALITQEHGKTFSDAQGELTRWFGRYSGICLRYSTFVKR